MPRKPALCAGGCGGLVNLGKGSLPPGQATCRKCRGQEPRPYGPRVQSAEPDPATLTCAVCDREFPFACMRGTRVPRKTCGEKCRRELAGLNGGLTSDLRIARATKEHPCPDCSQPTVGYGKSRCEECKARAAREKWIAQNARRRAPLHQRTCASCPNPIGPRRQKYCSECAEQPKERVAALCAQCGLRPVSGVGRMCSDDCRSGRRRQVEAAARAAKAALQPPRRCASCPNPTPAPARMKCDDCLRSSKRARRYYERGRRGMAREPYTLAEIAARDRYKCGICRRRVRMELVVPHGGAPTIDHVLPLADGGDDVRANVRLAHFHCNSVRGNRGGPVQLALVG